MNKMIATRELSDFFFIEKVVIAILRDFYAAC